MGKSPISSLILKRPMPLLTALSASGGIEPTQRGKALHIAAHSDCYQGPRLPARTDDAASERKGRGEHPDDKR
jgi:hypothetical protein